MTEIEAQTAQLNALRALLAALAKVFPILVEDGPDYAQVYFANANGAQHSTQAMTMNPRDWQDIAAAYEAALAAVPER